MTTDEAFRAFKSALELPDRHQNAASTAQQEIRSRVANQFEITSSFLTGSYARHTKIHPLNDIDVIFVRNSTRVPLKTEGDGVVPTAALSQLAAAVRSTHSTAVVKIQARSVNVQMPGQAFGFDLIPAWYRTPNGYWIPDSESGNWIPTDPQAHATLMTEANEASNGMLKPLIKMTKHWSRNNLDRLRSFHIELICKDIIAQHAVDSWSFGMATCLVYLEQYVGQLLMDPIYASSRVDKPLTPQEQQELISRIKLDSGSAIEALKLEGAGAHADAIEKWKHIFMAGF